jgi:hypothetical protein
MGALSIYQRADGFYIVRSYGGWAETHEDGPYSLRVARYLSPGAQVCRLAGERTIEIAMREARADAAPPPSLF